MEDEKAAAYYDELTRKGEGAARFKRGLGFSSGSGDDQHDAVPQRASAFVSSSSSFLTSFVRASSPTTASKLEKQSQLLSIQNKLKNKPEREARVSERDRDKHSRRRSRSRSRSRERRRRSRSRSKERGRRRSRSRSPRKYHRRSRSRSPRQEGKLQRRRRRSSSLSPRESRRSERHGAKEGKSKKEKNGAVDYSRLIKGYDSMV